MVWISHLVSIVLTFYFLEPRSRDQSECTNIFHSKKKFLSIVLKYYRDKVLERKQVFFVHLLLVDMIQLPIATKLLSTSSWFQCC